MSYIEHMSYEAITAFCPELKKRQVRYDEQRMPRDRHYKGPASQLSDHEAADQLYDAYCSFGELPPPPHGLPGAQYQRASETVMELLKLGMDYFIAVLHREPRRQINVYQEAEAAIRRAYWAGKEDMRKEWEDHDMRMATATAQLEMANRTGAEKVYFIGSEMGQIKIGMALNPEKRLRGLQTSHPAKLTILATCDGGHAQEHAYHQMFASHRLHGEWFERHPDILAEIDHLNSQRKVG